MHRVCGILLIVITAALLASCHPTGVGSKAPSTGGVIGSDSAWPFWPTHMRIHPLTRLTRDADDHIVLEAHIEFTDRDNSTSKAVGTLTLVLRDAPGRPDDESAPAGSPFNQNLNDLALNRRQYDEVMRTYLFRLQIEPDQLPEHPVLWAYFVSADDVELKAQMPLRR